MAVFNRPKISVPFQNVFKMVIFARMNYWNSLFIWIFQETEDIRNTSLRLRHFILSATIKLTLIKLAIQYFYGELF
ncbi:hypothetical protein Y032_0648g1112 [Ancylostoma ceylanicum]|uniref:Uncharacterized protein n=1 Tax=Ancylostoma ceylanicum TaxID=53326 RepID=A0A016WIK5_9BILA|nr:hypothetical protein Y032_0648g1112 [Ancylostoma ceylanicum]